MDSDTKIIDLASERRRRGPRFNGGLMDILEVSRDLVCMCRGGHITAINGAGARLLGARTTEELIGRSMAEFLIPEYGPVMALFLAGMSSEDKPVPTRILALDHSIKDVELQVYRAREIGADATVVMCRDISQGGKLAVPGLVHETEQRFHLLVDNSMNMVCHVVDGIIRYVNRAGTALLGSDAITGRPLKDIFHSDYAELFGAGMIAGLIAEDAPVPLRLRLGDGNGLDAMVKITRLSSQQGEELMVEARDITAQNLALMALRNSNETLEMRVLERTNELDEQRDMAVLHRHVAEAERRFSESLIDTIPSPVWFRDALGLLQASNRAFRQLFGDEPICAEDSRTDALLLSGSQAQASFEAAVTASDGSEVEGLFLKSAYLDDEGQPAGIIAMMADITERKAMEAELRRLATTDPLTEAANRRHFFAAAGAELGRSLRYAHDLSVIMLDVDFFKRVNDTYGHPGGDAALKALVATCRGALRENDLIGRLGGEEFAILLPETPLVGAMDVAERLRQRVAAIRVPLPDGSAIAYTCSFGVAERGEETRLESILASADKALYRAKTEGRNRVLAG